MELKIPTSELDTYTAFLDEAREHLDSMEQKVLGMAESGDTDAVNNLFRALHSIKGVASFLGLADIQRLSHHLESVFDRIRQGGLAVDADIIRICLENLDNLKAMLGNLESGIACRVPVPNQNFLVVCAEVDYLDGYAELEALLLDGASPEAASASAKDPVDVELEAAIAAYHAAEKAKAEAAEAPAPAAASAPASRDSLITREMEVAFLKEGEELLEVTEQTFLKLGDKPGDMDALSLAFRNVHSFKSNCGFFGYADLEKLSHRLESVLDAGRSASGLQPPALEAALRCIDALQSALSALAGGGSPAVADLDRHLALLDSVQPPPLGEILMEKEGVSPETIREALEIQNRPIGKILVEEGMASPESVERALKAQAEAKEKAKAEAAALPAAAPKEAAKAAPGKEVKRDLRVDLAKLDLLLDLVGELVISTGMVFNHPVVRESGAADLEKAAHQLKGVVNDLQNVALGVRMIPVEGPFRKMTRLVHDLSSKNGKKVKLEFKGEDTEIDKNVADLIADPLVHMIRNSLDHGLEGPEERVAAGKHPMGTVSLEAGQEGGDILITIRDDGRGMNRERILRKAKEKGLAGDEADAMRDEDVFQFIFMPGFSTAEAVTATSGRGVGMDVVKSNIDKLNGRITIRSRPGLGSAITMRIPLTLSIIDGMMVSAGGALFLLPLGSVRESLSPEKDSLFKLAGGQEMILIRGRSLPIVRLHRLQGIPGARTRLTDGILVCVEAHGTPFCLFVDELLGQRQTVVKALPDYLGRSKGVSSCSILDNGDISLILDLAGLFEHHQQTDLGEPEAASEAAADWTAVPGPRVAGAGSPEKALAAAGGAHA